MKVIKFRKNHLKLTAASIQAKIDLFWGNKDLERRFILPFWQFDAVFDKAIKKGSTQVAIVLHNYKNKFQFAIELIPFTKKVLKKNKYKDAVLYLIPNYVYDDVSTDKRDGHFATIVRFHDEINSDYPTIVVQYSGKVDPSTGTIGPNGSGDGYPLKGGS